MEDGKETPTIRLSHSFSPEGLRTSCLLQNTDLRIFIRERKKLSFLCTATLWEGMNEIFCFLGGEVGQEEQERIKEREGLFIPFFFFSPGWMKV